MLKMNTARYVHMYIDVTDETVYFHSTSTFRPLGKSLLDFIYTDLDAFVQNIDGCRDLHPYFILWTDDELFQLSRHDFTDHKSLNIDRLKELQETFSKLLDAFVYGVSDNNDSAAHYFERHPFYSSGTTALAFKERSAKFPFLYCKYPSAPIIAPLSVQYFFSGKTSLMLVPLTSCAKRSLR